MSWATVILTVFSTAVSVDQQRKSRKQQKAAQDEQRQAGRDQEASEERDRRQNVMRQLKRRNAGGTRTRRDTILTGSQLGGTGAGGGGNTLLGQ